MNERNKKSRLQYVKGKDIFACFIFLLMAPIALLGKIFIRDFWLVGEEKCEARDNGYWFFKYVRENHPKQKIAYVIDKHCADYQKVKDLGKVIQWGSLKHYFWYLVAKRNISSQKGCKPNAAACYLFEVVFKLRKNNRVFLQHGVTINKGSWLFYKNTQMRLFITAAQPEYAYIVKEFGYPEQNVVLCGFPRFDALHDAKVDPDLVLVMPTWRNWLGRVSHDNQHLDFTTTEYFKHWNAFLNSDEVAELLERHNKRLLFYPHRNMQKFISYFSTQSDRIEIADWKHYDVQDLLKRAAILITDYSSVFFDFSYMRKPVIFYQFDEAEFREKQYAEGYFDYHDTVLGKWAGTEEETIQLLEESLSAGCPRLPEETVRQFFPLWDIDNCKRNYEAICEV